MNFCARSLSAGLLLLSTIAVASEDEVMLVIREHRFIPSEIRIPAGKRIKLLVENQDAAAEEFESHQLNREKLIAAGTRATIYIGPLDPGRYPFYGEFHQETAQGAIVAQ